MIGGEGSGVMSGKSMHSVILKVYSFGGSSKAMSGKIKAVLMSYLLVPGSKSEIKAKSKARSNPESQAGSQAG